MNIGILSVATGKYIQFLEPLYSSIQKNFLVDHNKIYVVFTDNKSYVEDLCKRLSIDSQIIEIQRKGFPGDTLYRYHYFSSAEDILRKRTVTPDFVFYLDADMLIVDNVGEEILPTKQKSIVATAHPGFYNRPGNNPLGTPETRQESTAFIPPGRKRPCYWAGGFNGGEFNAFMSMSKTISKRIDIDDQKNIMAVWHDESHLNAYLSEELNIEKVKTLNPSYCYPESWNIPFSKKIIALDKNHKEIRG